jgi:hypothetical protein
LFVEHVALSSIRRASRTHRNGEHGQVLGDLAY